MQGDAGFFSVSTNQEYYTLPAYLPLLLLIAATITRAEQTYAHAAASRRWLTFAHATFTGLGWVFALALVYGLIASRKLLYTADVGALLARRGLGDYTLSTSHLFDLTTVRLRLCGCRQRWPQGCSRWGRGWRG